MKNVLPAIITFILLSLNLSAQNWVINQSFTGENQYEYWGQDVAIDGNIAICSGNAEARRVHVYERTGDDWAHIATLTPPTNTTAANEGLFGSSIAIGEDVIVVSSTFYNGFTGRVYLYEKPVNGWADMTPTTTLSTSEALPMGANFGNEIAIENNTIVIGAPSTEGSEEETGRAYIYQKPANGWSNLNTEDAILRPSNPAAYDWFGIDVDIDNDVIVIGSAREEESGTAYLFEKPATGWSGEITETTQINAADGFVNDFFGRFVKIKNAIVVSSITGNNPNPAEVSNALYIFEKGQNWSEVSQVARLAPTNVVSEDAGFGVEINIQNDRIFAGQFSGSEVFIFEKSGQEWSDMTETSSISSSNPNDYNGFGRAIAVEGVHVMIGNRNVGTDTQGEVHFYQDLDYISKIEETEIDFSLYPNPTNGYLSLSLPNNEVFSAKIFSALGRTVSEFSGFGTLDIDLSNVSEGVYFLSLMTADNKTAIRKIIFQKN